MSNIFDSAIVNQVERNKFDLSHDLRLSMNMGLLIPTTLIETLPGDSFQFSVENMARYLALIAPVMHKVEITTHFFFVPNRILWPNWEKWITGQYEVEAPYCYYGTVPNGSIGDYLGVPNTLPVGTKISALPLAAYLKIYDEYYRDQNLIAEKFVSLSDGNNGGYNSWLVADPLRVAWEHDYFTSCLPWPQKGDAAILPIQESPSIVTYNAVNNFTYWKKKGGNNVMAYNAGVGTEAATGKSYAISYGDYLSYDPQGTLEVDLTSVAVDINAVRKAFRLQEWLELNARGGTRYDEHINAHFGVKTSDARLHHPEYIGGSKQTMVISEVLTTAQTEVDTQVYPVGNMAGHGISVGGGNVWSYYCEEHGFIMGLVFIRPKTAYYQGIHRTWQRTLPTDYAFPVFADLGEQEVYTKELYSEAPADEVFGYVPRYSEYRFMNSRVAGDMKDTLDYWHLVRQFPSKPVLNESFINCVPDDRIFAINDETHKVVMHIFNNISVLRKLPLYGIPTL